MQATGSPVPAGGHPPPLSWVAPILAAFVVPVVVSLLLHAFLREPKWVDEPVHSAVETLGGAIALGVAFFLIARRAYPGQPDHYEWVVPALFSMGLLDLVHATLRVSPAFFWSRALPTFLGGLLVSLVWVPVARLPPSLRRRLPLLAVAATLPLCVALLAAPEAWPRLFDAEGRYSLSAKALNFAGGLGFLAAGARFLRAWRRTGNPEDLIFFSHCLLFGTAGLLFLLSHMWGAVWWFFHALRFGAYAVVLAYVVHVVRGLRTRQLEGIRSDLRATERELDDKSERLDLAMEAARLGSWDWDLATGRIRWSPQTAVHMGYPPGHREPSYSDWMRSIHPEDRQGVEEAVRQGLESRGGFQGTYRVIPPGSTEVRWIISRGMVHRDPSGVARRVVGIVWDTTESKRAEEELRASREQLEAILHNVYDAVVVQDGAGRLVYANATAARLLGFPSVEALRQAEPGYFVEALEVTDEFGTPLPYERYPAARARRGEEVAPQPVRWRIKATGEEHWVYTGARPVRAADGSVAFVLAYAHDITERRAIEESLRKSREMLRQSQKMEAIGRLAGGVAHDFNNLLTAINGFAELAQAGLPEDDPVQPSLDEIRKAGERAAGLTRQLLAFGRKQMLAPKRLNLNPLVEGMLDLVRRLIGEHILVEVDLAPDLADVKVDPGQMEQVLLNLAINARDAMPKGGRLVLRSWNEGEKAAGSGPMVCLAVEDTGHGMDAAMRERIFEPFFTTKGFGKGSGLGLATVHGIVAQSGGTIAVESEPNRGASFVIRLPAETGAEEPAAPGPEGAPAQAGGGETLLVAEDEESVRRLACSVLRGKGYRVLEAADGEEAMARQAGYAGSIPLLITDVIMPHLNGRELSERLRGTRPGIATLFMSGYADMETVGEIESGPDRDFLSKPFTASELLAAVHRLLRKASGAREEQGPGVPEELKRHPPP